MSSSSKRTASNTHGEGRAPDTGHRAGVNNVQSTPVVAVTRDVEEVASHIGDLSGDESSAENVPDDDRAGFIPDDARAGVNRTGARDNEGGTGVAEAGLTNLQLDSSCSESSPQHPNFHPMSEPSFMWGCHDGKTFCKIVDTAYNEAVHWRRNIFKIPSGRIGKQFTKEMARLFKSYARISWLECITLKAAMLMPVLLLQKPSRSSKAQDHAEQLERRLRVWLDGGIEELIREGRVIQNHLYMGQNESEDHLAQSFARLMFEGKTHAALRLLTCGGRSGKVLPLDTHPMHGDNPMGKTVREELAGKHPAARPVSKDVLLPQLPTSTTHPVLFESITASSIKAAAMHIKGAAGPSGLDSMAWQRLCCSFKGASTELCTSLAMVARRICTEHVDNDGLDAFVASRLIALDKCPGVRPIGIGEVCRRIIAKTILQVVGNDVREATGARQLCAGQQAGTEAAVHAIRELFSKDESEGVLLVDATNAFNNINRNAALHNIRQLCPSIATVLTNTYRKGTDLYIDGEVLQSTEGTTQGDALAMAFYALATVPLADACSVKDLNDVWFADDASASGWLRSLRVWWSNLCSIGPSYGYFPNAEKSWLVVHEDKLEEAQDVFADTEIQISTSGRRELGSPIGSRSFIEDYVSKQVDVWTDELRRLCSIARSQPQAAYCAFCQRLRSKWLYLTRTIPGVSTMLQPLEDVIRMEFIPVITGQPAPNDVVRALLALPVRLGGLAIIDPTKTADAEYESSIRVTAPLVALIVAHEKSLGDCHAQQHSIRKEIHAEKRKNVKRWHNCSWSSYRWT